MRAHLGPEYAPQPRARLALNERNFLFLTLINTARLGVIDEEGLMKMFGERLDFVYLSDISPSCKDEIVSNYNDKRYFFTPKKMGAQTAEANINAGVAAANQIVKFFEDGDLTFKVN